MAAQPLSVKALPMLDFNPDLQAHLNSITDSAPYIISGMALKEFLKRSPFLITTYRKCLRLRMNAQQFGLLPISFTRLARLPRYINERNKFLKMGGAVSLIHPITSEYRESAGTASGHYFHQDLLVSQFIFQANPVRHIDIGSRIDGFVAHVAAFRKIEIFDIRELSSSNHPNIEYRQANLMMGAGNQITDSLSCLHTIEHFGLGRYGDPIDPKGYIVGFNNLIEMLKPGGVLYISFPIGITNQVHFNAHRVFHPKDIFSWASTELQLLRFDYVDDSGDLHKNFDVMNVDPAVAYGCGIYTFRKN